MKHRHPGFTLVELLVTIVIIITLMGVSFAGFRSIREKARMTTEVGAARNLITAYLGNAADNNGMLMPGFKDDSTVTNLKGDLVMSAIGARYPFRLAPSVPTVRGVFFYNGNEKLLDAELPDYMVSLKPNMGINATFVGGYFKGSTPLDASQPRIVAAYGDFYASRLSQVEDPAKLMVFASARDDESPGYFVVTPPQVTNVRWTSAKQTPTTPAESHGHVDFRWGGKAVTVMLGGNVELHTEKELRDMRFWSHQAAHENDPSFMVMHQ